MHMHTHTQQMEQALCAELVSDHGCLGKNDKQSRTSNCVKIWWSANGWNKQYHMYGVTSGQLALTMAILFTWLYLLWVNGFAFFLRLFADRRHVASAITPSATLTVVVRAINSYISSANQLWSVLFTDVMLCSTHLRVNCHAYAWWH